MPTINISDEFWKELHLERNRNETFEALIKRKIGGGDVKNSANSGEQPE